MRTINIGYNEGFDDMTLTNTGKKLICNVRTRTVSTKITSVPELTVRNLFFKIIDAESRPWGYDDRINQLFNAVKSILV